MNEPRYTGVWAAELPKLREAIAELWLDPLFAQLFDRAVDAAAARNLENTKLASFMLVSRLAKISPLLSSVFAPAERASLIIALVTGHVTARSEGVAAGAEVADRYFPSTINRLSGNPAALGARGAATVPPGTSMRHLQQIRDLQRSYEPEGKRGRPAGGKRSYSETELKAIADAQAMKAPAWAARYPCGVSGQEKALDPANPDDMDSIRERWRRARKIKPTP